MAKKALCLSGGATRGAIKCLYEQYGFRPDIIAGTSVGAITGSSSRVLLRQRSTTPRQFSGRSPLGPWIRSSRTCANSSRSGRPAGSIANALHRPAGPQHLVRFTVTDLDGGLVGGYSLVVM